MADWVYLDSLCMSVICKPSDLGVCLFPEKMRSEGKENFGGPDNQWFRHFF